jgi:hypothetical protein
VVDVLDEYKFIRYRKYFLSIFQEIEDASIKFFIISRFHSPDIRRAFNNKSRLNIIIIA